MQQEMQDLKEKILQVNRDLFILEEDLLFPSSTQVNVFVSYDALEYFQLDGVSLKINDRPISNHLYTERELKAMNRGAVQRLFTGNLPVGEHELVAVVTGVGPSGRDYKRAVSLAFEKTSGTKYIELKIEGDDLRQQPGFRLKQWE
ncbi:MAG: AraC family transcriptional regulator [Pseudomonadales bacterium]|nr:AraC family transcriptional regulator [Pseudomonadales bacterium]